MIGIGPNNPNNEEEFYKKCWNFVSSNSKLVILSKNSSEYNNHSGRLKKGDIVEVIVFRKFIFCCEWFRLWNSL